MVAAEQAPAATSHGRIPAFTPLGVAVAITAIALVAMLAIQAWLSAYPPVRAGFTSAILGEAVACPMESGADAPTTCHQVPFEEGRGVGIGLTVRNEAPIAMTIVAVDAFVEGVVTPALLKPKLLEPKLPSGDLVFGLETGVPFEPVDVAPGGEQAIQLVGTYADCETVAEHYTPGSGLDVSLARLKVRWAVFETDVEVPLTTSLVLPAPTSC